jgi:hypothetical protein
MTKITPISSIMASRDKKKKRPTKEDFKRMIRNPPNDGA